MMKRTWRKRQQAFLHPLNDLEQFALLEFGLHWEKFHASSDPTTWLPSRSDALKFFRADTLIFAKIETFSDEEYARFHKALDASVISNHKLAIPDGAPKVFIETSITADFPIPRSVYDEVVETLKNGGLLKALRLIAPYVNHTAMAVAAICSPLLGRHYAHWPK